MGYEIRPLASNTLNNNVEPTKQSPFSPRSFGVESATSEADADLSEDVTNEEPKLTYQPQSGNFFNFGNISLYAPTVNAALVQTKLKTDELEKQSEEADQTNEQVVSMVPPTSLSIQQQAKARESTKLQTAKFPVIQAKSIPPAHLNPTSASTKNSTDVTYDLDWDAKPAGISFDQETDKSLREVYKRNLEFELKKTLEPEGWKEPNLERVNAVIQAKKSTDLKESERLRMKLWQAQQYAIVSTLKVSKSSRYKARDGKTFCINYAHDVVTALGAYLPYVWWNDWDASLMEKLEAGENVKPAYPGQPGANIHELNANDLDNWLQSKWGKYYGWSHTASANEAQKAANEGYIVVISAYNKTINENTKKPNSGHVTVVLAEQFIGDSDLGHRSTKNSDGSIDTPLQSQAGGSNFEFNEESTLSKWWDKEEMRQDKDENGKDLGNFWICKDTSKANKGIATPEELGASQSKG